MSDDVYERLQSAIEGVGGLKHFSNIMQNALIHMMAKKTETYLPHKFELNFIDRNESKPHLLTLMDVLSDESKTTVRILSNLVDNHDVEQLQNIWKHVFGDHENVSSISNLSKIMEGQSLIIYVSFRLYTYEQKQQLENAIEELGHQTTYMVLLRTCLKKMLESNTQGNYLISRSISTPN